MSLVFTLGVKSFMVITVFEEYWVIIREKSSSTAYEADLTGLAVSKVIVKDYYTLLTCLLPSIIIFLKSGQAKQ